MQSTSPSTATATVRRLALIISHALSPIILATLLLLSTALRHEQVSWPEALVAAGFTTIIPWLVLVLAKLRGAVTDMHVTQRSQRHWLYAMTAGLIGCGLVILWLMDASGAIFREVISILLGLGLVALINAWWKVSVHLSVGTYVVLQVAGDYAVLMPWVMLFLAVLSWARIRSFQHTASQVCGGVLVGVVIHYASVLLTRLG